MAETKITQSRRAGISTSKGLDEFRKKHDRNYIVPTRIKAALEEMVVEHEKKEPGKGEEAWEYDGEFVARTGLRASDVSAFKTDFAEHLVVQETGSRESRARVIWCGRAKTAKKLRAILGLD